MPTCDRLNFCILFILPMSCIYLFIDAIFSSSNSAFWEQNLLCAHCNDMHMWFVLLTNRKYAEGLCLLVFNRKSHMQGIQIAFWHIGPAILEPVKEGNEENEEKNLQILIQSFLVCKLGLRCDFL